jgi:hypothetical protein
MSIANGDCKSDNPPAQCEYSIIHSALLAATRSLVAATDFLQCAGVLCVELCCGCVCCEWV